ncbi:MAG: hypothetical protein QXH19_01735 [Candidatus Bathyarchaeia archaeon]
MIEVESSELKKREFTSRVLLAVLFALLVIAPTNLFLMLVGGSSLTLGAGIITLLLMVEIGRLTGNPLTKQEAFLIYFLCAYVAGTITPTFLTVWVGFINRTFNVNFPLWKSLGISDIARKYWWYVPEIAYNPYMPRVLGLDWLPNILLLLAGVAIDMALWVSTAFIIASLFARKEERMPFPAAQIQIQQLVGLVEVEPVRRRVLYLSGVAGVIWGLIFYVAPILSFALLGAAIEPGQLLYRDFTRALQAYLPGASLAFTINLATVMAGWVIPRNVVISAFISSLIFFFIGNHIALKIDSPYTALWRRDYDPGLRIFEMYRISYFDLWFGPFIGLTLAAGIAPVILNMGFYVRGIKSLFRRTREAGELSLIRLLALYFGATAASISISKLLILPDFPLWPYIAYAAFGFLLAILFGWGVAETGFGGPGIANVEHMLIWASGYRDIKVFLGGFPPATPGSVPAVLVNNGWIVGEACGVRPMTYIKWILVLAPVALALSFIYTNILWSLSPIPSNLFFQPAIEWPANAVQWLFWPSIITGKIPIEGRVNLDFNAVIISFVVASAFYALSTKLKLPFSFIGFIIGASPTFYIDNTLAWFIGMIIEPLLRRFLGEDWWKKYKITLPAGFGIGISVSTAIAAAIYMIKASLFASPY